MTTPNSYSTTCKLFSSDPPPTPAPFPISSKFELKQQKPLQLLSLAEGGDHGAHSGTCATDAVRRRTKAQILWYALTYYHI